MGGGVGVLWLRWYMAERRARTSSLPEESRERQNCPFCLCDSPRLEALLQGRALDFPCSVNWYKKHKNSSWLWSSVQSVVWNEGIWKIMATLRIFWGKLCRSPVVGGKVRRGKSEESESQCLLDAGGLRLIEVTGTAVGVVVWHVDRGTIQIEVAAARAAGEAADWTPPPGQDKVWRNNLTLCCFQQFWTFANLLSCRLWGEKINTTLTSVYQEGD